MKCFVLLVSIALLLPDALLAQNSKIYFWKLTLPLPFAGKPGLIDALRITSINDMSLNGATIVYEEGWMLKEDPLKPNVVTSVLAPPGSGSKSLRLSGDLYTIEASKKPDLGLTRIQDLVKSFYEQLGKSKPEYAGVLVIIAY